MVTPAGSGRGTAPDQVLEIDGAQPLSAGLVTALAACCDQAESAGEHAAVLLRVSGAPGAAEPDGLTVALVSRWERALRRLERLPAVTIAVAPGDCGGTALDALLAADYRIGAAGTRLVPAFTGGATWPGMALYRLAHQAGAAAVRRAVLFGTPIGAADALAMHLLDELADDLDTALAAAAELAGACSGAELAIRRWLMLEARTVSFEDALGTHLSACDRALRRTAAARAG